MSQIRKLTDKTHYIAYVAASIDGRIAKNNHSGTPWTSQEDWNFFQKSLAKIDAVVAGHNTYKVARNNLKKRNTVVLTSKVNQPESSGQTVFLNPEKTSLRKFLQSKKYKKVAILGGARVYDFCLRNKMLDELFVTIEPYVFTVGVPMFLGSNFKKYKFHLEFAKQINQNGTILLHYLVK